MRRTRILAALICLVLASAFAVSACSPSTPLPTASASAGPATPSATSTNEFPREAAHPDPSFDTGYTVQITATGVHPQTLVSPCCKAITWVNTTSAPVSVVFAAVPGGSPGPIPPGGTYVFVPPAVVSIAYHAGTDPVMAGVVAVNQLPQ